MDTVTVTISALQPRLITITGSPAQPPLEEKIEPGQTVEVNGQQRMVISVLSSDAVGNGTITVATPFYLNDTLAIEISESEYTIYRHNPYPMSGR